MEQQINVLESQNCNKNLCTENMLKTDKMRKSDTFSRKYGYLKCVSFEHTTVYNESYIGDIFQATHRFVHIIAHEFRVYKYNKAREYRCELTCTVIVCPNPVMNHIFLNQPRRLLQRSKCI